MWWALFLLVLPLLGVVVDGFAGIRSRHIRTAVGDGSTDDFRVLVPIWGSMRYLTNAAALDRYGSKVTLCTTGDETAEFYRDMHKVALAHGFDTFIDARIRSAWTKAATQKARAVSGTVRDRLIRAALAHVRETYVIALDADSVPGGPLGRLAGELARRGLDVASVRLVPSNPGESVLTRLQALEYRVAMQVRFVAPWMLSGACHAARTAVLADVMARHSLYMQGNDVEVGVIAWARGYKVGHIPFVVSTDVPAKVKPWARQRLAWAGGQFRLFIVNVACGRWHPFMWFYGGVVTFSAIALRWEVADGGWRLAAVAGAYLALCVYLYARRGGAVAWWWVLAMPAYAAVLSFILAPLGMLWYLKMSVESGSWGIIRPGRRPVLAGGAQ